MSVSTWTVQRTFQEQILSRRKLRNASQDESQFQSRLLFTRHCSSVSETGKDPTTPRGWHWRYILDPLFIYILWPRCHCAWIRQIFYLTCSFTLILRFKIPWQKLIMSLSVLPIVVICLIVLRSCRDSFFFRWRRCFCFKRMSTHKKCFVETCSMRT